MMLKWFLSRTVRQATEMSKQVRKILDHQRDLLTPQAISAIQSAGDEVRTALRSGADKTALMAQMDNLEKVANKWLKPYPNASIRENVEVFLVAVAVAMGIRTFFLQPFKIPTGSMQPTLYGITHENLMDKPNENIPGGFARFFDSWVHGISYYHVTAQADGDLRVIEPPQKVFLPFIKKQRFMVGDVWYTVWFPDEKLFVRALLQNEYSGQPNPKSFHQGEAILKLKVSSGDHLFVDRLTYNFRRPTRGETIVFETKGIDALPQDQFYIKRLVALGGEHVRIGNDQHLIINGARLDASTPRFENVYTFGSVWRENHYFGHANNQTGSRVLRNSLVSLAPNFLDEKQEYVVKPDHCLVMGDNTMNSHDSRAWGDFPQQNVIGKSCFVYWPISSRFGWGHR